MNSTAGSVWRRCWRCSYSLIEVAISTVIVGTMLVAALEAVAVAKVGLVTVQRQSTGLYLAEDLMSEILQQAYVDADAGLGSFGRSAEEAATGDRSLFDDVDDYHGWSSSPPQEKDGAELSEFSDWERSVSVEWVDLLGGVVGRLDPAQDEPFAPPPFCFIAYGFDDGPAGFASAGAGKLDDASKGQDGGTGSVDPGDLTPDDVGPPADVGGGNPEPTPFPTEGGGLPQPTEASEDTGVKMITVTVRYRNAVVTELTALRTYSADITGRARRGNMQGGAGFDDLPIDLSTLSSKIINNFKGGK